MRHFEIRNEKHGETGGHRRVAMIFCGACGRPGSVPVQTAATLLPDEVVNKKFAHMDWHVGATPQKDLCPECSRTFKVNGAKMTNVQPLTPKVLNGGSTDQAVQSLKPSQQAFENSPSREMSRDDRRVIFAAIKDHYPEGAKGYTKEWSDQRIATETKMPRKWVEAVRVEFFGDTGVNPEMQEFLDQFKQLHADALAFLDRAMVIRKQVDAILADHLFANVQQISDRQSALDKLADKVRKHII